MDERDIWCSIVQNKHSSTWGISDCLITQVILCCDPEQLSRSTPSKAAHKQLGSQKLENYLFTFSQSFQPPSLNCLTFCTSTCYIYKKAEMTQWTREENLTNLKHFWLSALAHSNFLTFSPGTPMRTELSRCEKELPARLARRLSLPTSSLAPIKR